MRLSTEEITEIVQTLNSHITEPSTLYLHGSRTDDQRRGGDIDLLILTSQHECAILKNKKHILLYEIKEKIGDQKIDLTIVSRDDTNQDPFLKITLKNAILLAQL